MSGTSKERDRRISVVVNDREQHSGNNSTTLQRSIALSIENAPYGSHTMLTIIYEQDRGRKPRWSLDTLLRWLALALTLR